jgi:hypothetical protein
LQQLVNGEARVNRNLIPLLDAYAGDPLHRFFRPDPEFQADEADSSHYEDKQDQSKR